MGNNNPILFIRMHFPGCPKQFFAGPKNFFVLNDEISVWNDEHLGDCAAFPSIPSIRRDDDVLPVQVVLHEWGQGGRVF